MIILFTSAIIDDFFEKRKNEYIDSFGSLVHFGYKENTHIVECVSSDEETFLNNLTNNVFYSKKGYVFKNKGVNEILNIKHFLESTQISNEESIVKLTGRYLLLDDVFLKQCENEQYDVLYKRDAHNQAFFGCISIKYKVLYEFINSTNWIEVENNFISIEKVFFDYILTKKINIKEVEKINIKCNINNSDLHIF